MEEDGCTADELEEAMKMVDQIEGDLNTKCLNIASWVRNLEAEAKAIKEAQDAMDKRRKAATAKAERLRNYLFHGMKLAGVTKMQFPALRHQCQAMPGVGADCPRHADPRAVPAPPGA